IAVVDSTAFVLRSDGELFEVVNFLSDAFEVKTHDTPFSGKNNMESLTFDKEKNRLLVMPKDKDLKSSDFIGIYAFNLQTNKMDPKPGLSRRHNHPIINRKNQDHDEQIFNGINPADIAINPLDGKLYVLEAKKPKLLIVNSGG